MSERVTAGGGDGFDAAVTLICILAIAAFIMTFAIRTAEDVGEAQGRLDTIESRLDALEAPYGPVEAAEDE